MARTVTRPRLPKRKEPASEPKFSPPTKRLKGDNTHFPFLELPRELRDEIYRHIVESDQSTTLRNRNLITKCGLVGVNNQICEEFLDAVLFHAPVISTTVRNHNFAHVVTFLNRLSEAQLQRFKGSQAPVLTPRKIRITLTYSNTKSSTTPQLNRWLDRFDDPDRRGAEIDFEYVLDRASWGNGGYKQRPKNRSTAGKRASEEASKIMESARGARNAAGGYETSDLHPEIDIGVKHDSSTTTTARQHYASADSEVDATDDDASEVHTENDIAVNQNSTATSVWASLASSSVAFTSLSALA